MLKTILRWIILRYDDLFQVAFFLVLLSLFSFGKTLLETKYDFFLSNEQKNEISFTDTVVTKTGSGTAGISDERFSWETLESWRKGTIITIPRDLLYSNGPYTETLVAWASIVSKYTKRYEKEFLFRTYGIFLLSAMLTFFVLCHCLRFFMPRIGLSTALIPDIETEYALLFLAGRFLILLFFCMFALRFLAELESGGYMLRDMMLFVFDEGNHDLFGPYTIATFLLFGRKILSVLYPLLVFETVRATINVLFAKPYKAVFRL